MKNLIERIRSHSRAQIKERKDYWASRPRWARPAYVLGSALLIAGLLMSRSFLIFFAILMVWEACWIYDRKRKLSAITMPVIMVVLMGAVPLALVLDMVGTAKKADLSVAFGQKYLDDPDLARTEAERFLNLVENDGMQVVVMKDAEGNQPVSNDIWALSNLWLKPIMRHQIDAPEKADAADLTPLQLLWEADRMFILMPKIGTKVTPDVGPKSAIFLANCFFDAEGNLFEATTVPDGWALDATNIEALSDVVKACELAYERMDSEEIEVDRSDVMETPTGGLFWRLEN